MAKILFGRNRNAKKICFIAIVSIVPLFLLILVLHFKSQDRDEKPRGSSLLQAQQNASVVDFDRQSIHLVVLIISNPTKSATRRAIRETWLSSLSNSRVKHFFIIGSKGLAAEVLGEVKAENTTHEDLVILDSVAESYESLTSKVLSSFQWLVSNYQFNFVLKCDDDTYVTIPPLLEALAKHPQVKLYWGFFKGAANVFRKGKWKEDDWFLCDTYLPYARGGGYVLSSDLVRHLTDSAPLLQHYKSEDVSVGLWLSPLKINRVHDVRFDTEFKSRGCFNSYLVTHKQSAKEMREKHSHLVRTGNLCPAEIRLRYSYNYNWTVPSTECCKNFDTDLP
uniref:Hexosyltransferase n=1 Tax=Alona affinis TaxID=381656 RepID=A0A9N6ZDN6_9CRUS|nr:EOG090X0A8N [Alona affinis]